MSSGRRPDAAAIPDREAEALHEIAATRAAPLTPWSAILLFSLLCLFGAVAESIPSLRAHTASWPRTRIVIPSVDEMLAGWSRRGWSGANFQLLRSIGTINRYTERDSVASRLLRPPIQGALVRHLRYGNGQVLVGEGGWLAFAEDWSHVVGPPFLDEETLQRRHPPGWRLQPTSEPDPVEGLVRLKRQLRRHGAQLVFLPVPNKVEIVPWKLRPGSWTAPPRNPSFALLLERLEERGIAVYDPAPDLFRLATSGTDVYLEGDTHWSPVGMEVTARGLARFLESELDLPRREKAGFVRRPARISKSLDLQRLLGFPRPPFAQERRRSLEVDEVLGAEGGSYLADDGPADVVLLGDSYSMVYRSFLGRLGRETVGAGLAEQLAAELERPVSMIAFNQKNDLAQRTRWLAERPKVLAAARVVVYEVAVRTLSTGDWTPGKLVLGPRREAPDREDANMDEEERR